MKINLKFSERLKELRLENNLTQKELAQKLGIAASSISAWERGDYLPSKTRALTILYNLSVIFEASTDYILGVREIK